MFPFSAFFVTGTDTGIGKTVTSTSLLQALRARGMRAVGMKPLASGCEATPEGWRNEDALALQAASLLRPDYALVNPYALPEPLAPEIAAAEAGVSIYLAPLRTAFDQLRLLSDVVVVEGVGGWAAPLSATLDQADLARALDLPVVLVVGMRLGCLNHARLSAAAIAADGLQCVGWVANEVDPDMARRDENFALLTARLPMPCWGRIPYQPDAAPATRAAHLRLPG